jgi:uncharacterized protein (TIGR03086 family)
MTTDEHIASRPDHAATLRAVVDAATAVIHDIEDEQLTNPTPCSEWDVRDLLNHLVATSRRFAIAADKGRVGDAEAEALAGDVLGSDFHEAWAETGKQLLLAFERPEVLGKVLTLSSGDTPGDVAIDLAALEVGVHAADLARAIGRRIDDQAPFAAVLGILRARMTEAWRAPGLLDDEQPVSPQAGVVDQLLAYAGRRVEHGTGGHNSSA